MAKQHCVEDLLARGQRWRQKIDSKSVLRILATAEGYAMVRYRYCQVWAIDEKRLRN